MSGVTRTRYSHIEHFKCTQKVLRFIGNVLKISVLFILYLVVSSLDVKQKVDRIRQKWTCDVLFFYNCFLFVTTCLLLAFKVTKYQALVMVETFFFAVLVAIFTYYSMSFFVRGMFMYEDLPKN